MLERIKQLCENHNLTIAALERKANVGRGSIGRWDTNAPSIDKVQKVASYFNVSLDYLFGNTDNPQVMVEISGEDLPEVLKNAGAKSMIIGKDDYARMSEDELREVALNALQEIEKRKAQK